MECRDWAIATGPPASQAPARELPTSKPEEISPFPAAGSSLKIVWFARAPWFALYGRRLEWFSEIVIPAISKRRNDVHAANFGNCARHDDYQRDLLGIVGQHL